MKKLLIVPLILLSLTQLGLSQDTKPTTTAFKPTVGQKLLFKTKMIKNGAIYSAQEHVTIKKINKDKKTVDIFVELWKVKDNPPRLDLLEEGTDVEWAPLAPIVLQGLLGGRPLPDGTREFPARETVTVGNQTFNCVVVTVKGQTIWFPVDSEDNNIFPGVVRLEAVINGKKETIMQLVKIEQPKPVDKKD